jgi:6-phosphogluconate dehydrogenase
MQLGMVGLGRMGSGMTLRLLQGGHQVVVFDHHPESIAALGKKGATGAANLEELGLKLTAPRVIWLMIPAGAPVDDTIQRLQGVLSPGDVIIDGGNSHYKDSMRRGEDLRSKQIEFLDVGVSGGIWGLKVGFCLMAGGNQAVFQQVEPILKTLAPPAGYAHVGPTGAGHYSKMVHNGIEYSMLQGYAEGFEILKASPFGFNLAQLSSLWNHGSVIRSWLLELAQDAFQKDPELAKIRGWVEDSGEGRWTLEEALERAVPVPALAISLFMRYRSRQDDSFSAKVLAALRNEFGGHPVKPEV